jgi:hypothetical protein
VNSDLTVPINWMLVVAIGSVIAVCIALWNHPAALRRFAARYIARAEALDQSRSAFECSLQRWNKRLGVPDPQPFRLRIPERQAQVKS